MQNEKNTSANKKFPHETEENCNGIAFPQANFWNVTKHLDSEIQKLTINGQNKKKCKAKCG